MWPTAKLIFSIEIFRVKSVTFWVQSYFGSIALSGSIGVELKGFTLNAQNAVTNFNCRSAYKSIDLIGGRITVNFVLFNSLATIDSDKEIFSENSLIVKR